MTKILDQAIAKAQALAEADQDVLGAVMLALAEEWPAAVAGNDAETCAAIREGLARIWP
jgi:hypothetical protein